jgi:hypothetical protein
MNFTAYSRELRQLIETVRVRLRDGHIPPDPETMVEYQAFKREFPEEIHRWEPPVEVRVQLLGEMQPPFSEEWDERFTSTVLNEPARHGRIFAHAITVANQEGQHE